MDKADVVSSLEKAMAVWRYMDQQELHMKSL